MNRVRKGSGMPARGDRARVWAIKYVQLPAKQTTQIYKVSQPKRRVHQGVGLFSGSDPKLA